MKRCWRTILLLLAVLRLPLSGVLAADSHVMDEAGILSETEAELLEQEAARITLEQSCGVYFIAVEDYTTLNGESAYACAKDLYRDRDLGWGETKDGELLLLSMSNRKFAIIAYGDYGNAVFTDQAKDGLDSVYLDNFRNDDWYGGVLDYLAESERLLSTYVPYTAQPAGEPKPDWTPEPGYEPGPSVYPLRTVGWFYVNGELLVGTAAVACIISLVVCLLMRARMRSVRRKDQAAAYIQADGVSLRVKEDTFTHSTESRSRIHTDNEDNNSGGIGGGATTVDSGGFSGHDGDF